MCCILDNSEIDISMDSTKTHEDRINNIVNETEQCGNLDGYIFDYDNEWIHTVSHNQIINNEEDLISSHVGLSKYYDVQYGHFYDMYEYDNDDVDVDEDLEDSILLSVTA